MHFKLFTTTFSQLDVKLKLNLGVAEIRKPEFFGRQNNYNTLKRR